MNASNDVNPVELIRALNPTSAEEIELVAARMRLTLIEVLGEEAGRSLYSMDWLSQRVRWHLDPLQAIAQIYLAENPAGHITGHTILRIERDDAEREFGLFSTTYVEPESRNRGVALRLLVAGEDWMRVQGMTEAVTDTSETNSPLIRLFRRRGYEIVHTEGGMIRLARSLS